MVPPLKCKKVTRDFPGETDGEIECCDWSSQFLEMEDSGNCTCQRFVRTRWNNGSSDGLFLLLLLLELEFLCLIGTGVQVPARGWGVVVEGGGYSTVDHGSCAEYALLFLLNQNIPFWVSVN